jgi:hypothetical protein
MFVTHPQPPFAVPTLQFEMRHVCSFEEITASSEFWRKDLQQ